MTRPARRAGLPAVAHGTVRAGTALAVASLGLTVVNLAHLRRPPPTPRVRQPAGWAESVAVLLPVRDEAGRVAVCVRALARSAARWPGPVRLVVLDDGSQDGTAELLTGLRAEVAAQSLPGLEVLEGLPTPPGWLGKPWACQQLADAASGCDVLVFVDADVVVTPDAVVATVALLRRHGLDLVSPYPHQRAETWAERLVQPLLQWSWASTLPLRLAERSPRPSLSAANGQLMAVDARAYARAGGHRAVRRQVLEDLALVRTVKSSGGRGGVADGSALASCRMYDGWADLADGYAKSLWSAFGSPAGALGAVGLLVIVHVVPALAALRGSRTGAVGYAAGVVSRALVARRTGTPVHPDAFAHPVSVSLLALLTARSLRGRRRGTLRWKGRAVEVAA